MTILNGAPRAADSHIASDPHCNVRFLLGVLPLFAAAGAGAAQVDRDHYSLGWFGSKAAAYEKSEEHFHFRYPVEGDCATFTELAPRISRDTFYEKRTEYVWDINNDGSCPADGFLRVNEIICRNEATLNGNHGCVPPSEDNAKNEGPQPLMCDNGSNPINTANGNKYQRETDYIGTAQGYLTFDRHFNSMEQTAGEMGAGWAHTYSRSILLNAVTPLTSNPVAILKRPDGQEYRFTWNNNAWEPDPDVVGRLSHGGTLTEDDDVPCPVGGMTYVNEQDETESYDQECRLTKISTRWGFEQTLIWTLTVANGGDGNALTLDRVRTRYIVTGGNQAITFERDSAGRIWKLKTPGNEITQYHYDSQSRLDWVDYPGLGGTTTRRTYHYDNSTYPFALTGITDENGDRYATYTYDSLGRAYISEHAGGADRVQLTYNTDGTTSVRSPLGQVRTHHLALQYDVAKVTQIDGGLCGECGSTTATHSYDSNGFDDLLTDFKGNQTDYNYNARGLEDQRIEAKTTPEERKIVTSWHPTWRVPVQVDVYDAGGLNLKRTEFTYLQGQVETQIEKDMQDPNPIGTARTTTYTYFDSGIRKGFLMKIDGPRTDVLDWTTFGYSTTTGNLLTVTNALDQVDTPNIYDNHGRLTKMTDKNGQVIEFTYHPRGWMLTRKVDGRTTTYTYDNVGQVDRVTLPTGVYLDYDYDDAHRLTDIRDNLTNHVHYELDAMGNRREETTRDQSSVLKRQVDGIYNERSQLELVHRYVTATTKHTTGYTYDDNGNIEFEVDPRDPSLPALTSPTIKTENLYDALNRVRQTTDTEGGVTVFEYDVFDNVTSVTDPEGHETTYLHNGFQELRMQTSPDAGMTNYLYDEAGNLKHKTDARNVLVTYTYDALNRLKKEDYPADPDTVYTYDETGANQNGVGRLTKIVDASGSTIYKYYPRGLISEKTVSINGISYTTSYVYDNADPLQSMTYPSGRLVSYQRDSAGRITQVDTTERVLVEAITHAPFGPITGWTYGSGLMAARGVDLDYRISTLSDSYAGGAHLMNRTYVYDPADNIDLITETVNAPDNNQDFAYDYLNRLTLGIGSFGRYDYTYDDVGNVQSKKYNQTPSHPLSDTFSYYASTNRLHRDLMTTVRERMYDAAGNLTKKETVPPSDVIDYFYDENSRLKQIKYNTSYNAYLLHNGLGQPTWEVAYIGPTLYASTKFLYDEAGQFTTQVNAAGAVFAEYLYLEGLPVGYVTGKTSDPTLQLYYVHPDHLGTIYAVTSAAGTLMYAAQYDPFGGRYGIYQNQIYQPRTRLPGQLES